MRNNKTDAARVKGKMTNSKYTYNSVVSRRSRYSERVIGRTCCLLQRRVE